MQSGQAACHWRPRALHSSAAKHAGCMRQLACHKRRTAGLPAKAKARLARTLPLLCDALGKLDRCQRRVAIESLSMMVRNALIKFREAEQEKSRLGNLPPAVTPCSHSCAGNLKTASSLVKDSASASPCNVASFGQNVRQVGTKAQPCYQVCFMVHRVQVRTTRLPTYEMAISAQRSFRAALQAEIAVPACSDISSYEDLLAEARLQALASAATSANVCITFQATLERVTGASPRRRCRVYSACLALAEALQLRREALNAETSGSEFVDSLWECWEKEGLRPLRHCKRSLDGNQHQSPIPHGPLDRKFGPMQVGNSSSCRHKWPRISTRGRAAVGAIPPSVAKLIARAERAAFQASPDKMKKRDLDWRIC